MVILGIDPGIAIVGYGIIEYKNNKFRVIDYGAVTTNANTPTDQRLALVYKGIDILIKKYDIKHGLVIGDRQIDIEAGKAAGMDTLLVDGHKSLLEIVT